MDLDCGTDKHPDAWNVLKDPYSIGYGVNGTLLFRIFGTSADDESAKPQVLSPPLMESLPNYSAIRCIRLNFLDEVLACSQWGVDVLATSTHLGAKHNIRRRLDVVCGDGVVFFRRLLLGFFGVSSSTRHDSQPSGKSCTPVISLLESMIADRAGEWVALAFCGGWTGDVAGDGGKRRSNLASIQRMSFIEDSRPASWLWTDATVRADCSVLGRDALEDALDSDLDRWDFVDLNCSSSASVTPVDRANWVSSRIASKSLQLIQLHRRYLSFRLSLRDPFGKGLFHEIELVFKEFFDTARPVVPVRAVAGVEAVAVSSFVAVSELLTFLFASQEWYQCLL